MQVFSGSGGGGHVPARRPAPKRAPVRAPAHIVLTAYHPKPVNRKIPSKFRAKPHPHPSFTLPALGSLPHPRSATATPVGGHTGQPSMTLQQAIQAQKTAAASAPTTTARVSPYANPLRGVQGLIPGRIDQGVDFYGQGGSPVYAIGPGKILRTSYPARPTTSWPGGGLIAYQLTGGPAKGTSVYVAEDITPAVAQGQKVTKNTVIGFINQLGYIPMGQMKVVANDR